jgi:hypothetical protein
LYGYKGWKRTTLGINYRGDYRRYERRSPYDSSNQFFVFGLTHQPSKHLSITLREGAGTYTRNFSYLGTFGFYDPTFAQVPQDELLDTRSTCMTTMSCANPAPPVFTITAAAVFPISKPRGTARRWRPGRPPGS